jgi:putative ABC transport system permease protein
VQRAVESVDPLLPIASFHTLEDDKDRALDSQRSNATLMAALAGLALAVVGIYGLVANSVVERTREFGIRMALGATVPAAVWTATEPGMLLSLLGVLIGMGLAVVSTRVLKSSLYGVQTLDPATFIIVAAGLVFIGTLASLVPALRLTRLSPSETLRQE